MRGDNKETMIKSQWLANVEGHCVESKRDCLRVDKIVKGRPRRKCYSLDHCLGKNSLSHHTSGQVKFHLKCFVQKRFLTCRQVMDNLAKG